MRIGIVLTITLNLPLRQLRGADLLVRADGHGDVSLALAGTKRIGWFHLAPHARPWALRDLRSSLRQVFSLACASSAPSAKASPRL
jgi:hypothetical protein